jgi:hypothetical protein
MVFLKVTESTPACHSLMVRLRIRRPRVESLRLQWTPVDSRDWPSDRHSDLRDAGDLRRFVLEPLRSIDEATAVTVSFDGS